MKKTEISSEKLHLSRLRQRVLSNIRMKCLCSGEQMRLIDEQDNKRPGLDVNSASAAEKLDNVNIDELELSLRETSSLNYEVRFSSSSLRP